MRKKEKNYFEGWYIKLLNGTETIALIVSCHRTTDGAQKVMLQILTEDNSYQIDFSEKECYFGNRFLRIGENVISIKGMHLHIVTERVTLIGNVKFSEWNVPQFDVMGPFAKVKCMPCFHTVHSIYHEVDGTLRLNGRVLTYKPGTCYIEGDRGCDFPRKYLWTQYTWEKHSLMFAIAELTMWKKTFLGCVGVLYADGKMMRIATYLGAKVIYADRHTQIVRQGKWLVIVERNGGAGQLLKAPVNGMLVRNVTESVTAQVHYRIFEGKRKVLDIMAQKAGFEESW